MTRHTEADARKHRHLFAYTLACGLIATLCGCATTVDPPSSSKKEPKLDIASEKYDSPNARTMYAMAKLFRLQERNDQAEVLLLKVISEYPEFSPAYCELAEIHLELGKVDGAIEVLKDGIEVSPNDSVLLNDLGVCHILQGEHALALEHFQKAAALNPIQKRYRANEALAHGLLGDEEASLRLYESIMTDAEANHNVSVIAEMLGSAEGSAPSDTAVVTLDAATPIK